MGLFTFPFAPSRPQHFHPSPKGTSLLFACCAILLGPTHFAQAETYTVTDIGHPGGIYSQAGGINKSGDVVGFIQLSGGGSEDTIGFVYSGGTVSTIPPLAGYDYSSAAAINNSGEIVGVNSSASSNNVAAFSQTPTKTTNLGTLGGTYAVASAINSNGEIVGSSTTAQSSQPQAFTYIGGVMTGLGANGGINSYANGVNDNGYVVGNFEDNNGLDHAFLYDPTSNTMNDLGSLVTDPTLYPKAGADAINNAADVVGYSSTDSGDTDAVEFTGGKAIDLGNLGGGHANASSINNLGQIVGSSRDANHNFSGFVYERGAMFNLNSLLDPGSDWQIIGALGINDSGQIAAEGFNTVTGQQDALLLTPNAAAVPTPAAIYGGGALLGLLILRSRRRTEQEPIPITD